MVTIDKSRLKPIKGLKITHYLTGEEISNIRKYMGLSPKTSDSMTVKALCKSVGRKKINRL